jgi:hypothetical protein
VERPERGLKRAHNVAAANDLGRIFWLERTGGNLGYFGRKNVTLPIIGV